jgi:hypothetical protein
LANKGESGPPCGPLLTGDAHPVLHQTGLKEASNDPKEMFVADPAREARHQDIVIDSIEKLLEIQIDDKPAPLLGYVDPRLF